MPEARTDLEPPAAAFQTLGHDLPTLLSLLSLLPDGALLVDRQGRIVAANTAFHTLCGHADGSLVGQPLTGLLPPAQRPRHQAHVDSFFAEPTRRPMGRVPQLALWHRDGHAVPVDISLVALGAGDTALALAVVHDLTDIHAMHERVRYLAMHDELTGLYGRPMFGELLAQAVEQARRSGQPAAMLLIDLDDFKAVNDSHGHAVGDALLQEVARRMRKALRAGDVLARLGGDEFAVLLHEAAGSSEALAVVHKLLAVIAQPWRAQHHEAFPSASIGVVFAPHDGDDAATLMRHADLAMYRAKAAGRGTYAVFDAAMARQLQERALLQSRLQRALETDALQLHYQPQVCAASGRVVGVEALLRWHDPELGPVSAARFIAVAEQTGLILRLGDWVVATACRQMARWREQGLQLRVAVNVSAHQLQQPGFADQLQTQLARWGLPPSQLELEITETAAMTQHDQARPLLQRLHALGVQLALDDFGTGHSSLAQLRTLPVSRLKMDRFFVRGLPADEGDAVLARAIIGLARTLGKAVVAEGVETAAQRDFLHREGCHELQGWLLARELPPDEVPQLARRLGV